MLEALRAALAALPGLGNLRAEELSALPAKGTAHGHVRIARPGHTMLARICYAHPGDPGAATRLHTQATAFTRLAPSARVPRLYATIEPSEGLPGGVLLVEAIDGRVPHLPDDLAALAQSLAGIHALPVPDPAQAAPLPYHHYPVRELMDAIEANAPFFERQAMDRQSLDLVRGELAWARGFAAREGGNQHPLSPALADTHPGNFLVRGDGAAIFLDLEKVHYGSAAIDLAHCTLPTSTRWDEDVNCTLDAAQLRDFYRSYFGFRPDASVKLKPWFVPLRRMTLLRTLAFCARWSVQTQAPRDPDDPGQWSDSGLEPHLRLRKRALIADYFRPATLRSFLAEWHGDRPFNPLDSL